MSIKSNHLNMLPHYKLAERLAKRDGETLDWNSIDEDMQMKCSDYLYRAEDIILAREGA